MTHPRVIDLTEHTGLVSENPSALDRRVVALAEGVVRIAEKRILREQRELSRRRELPEDLLFHAVENALREGDSSSLIIDLNKLD